LPASMKLTNEIIALLKKEILLEWRQKFAINGILLYLGSTVFVCYLSFGVKGNKLSPYVWNALFWVILLFASVNAIAKSFIQERHGRQIYYYSLVSPQGIIISKIVYNSLLMMLLSTVGFFFYSLVLGNPIEDKFLFFLNMILGSLGFSSTLTMVSGIASKANNGTTLMAILSFPIIIPLLLILIKISKNAIDGLSRSVSWNDLGILLAINIMIGAVSYLLFPYLWKS
jgi:heme exporter protein B